MKRWLPSIITGTIIIVTIVLQTAVWTAWPTLARYCNPMLIVIQLVFLFSHSNARTMLMAITIGSLVSLFSGLPFGVLLTAVIMATTTLVLLRRPVFQHPGVVMSMLAMAMMTLVYQLALFGVVWAGQGLQLLSIGDVLWWASLKQAGYQLLVHAGVVGIVIAIAQRFMTRDQFYLFDTTRDIT